VCVCARALVFACVHAYVCLCVCVRQCVSACARVCARVRVFISACMRACLHVFVRRVPACLRAHARACISGGAVASLCSRVPSVGIGARRWHVCGVGCCAADSGAGLWDAARRNQAVRETCQKKNAVAVGEREMKRNE
jgi:hypothetical protein